MSKGLYSFILFILLGLFAVQTTASENAAKWHPISVDFIGLPNGLKIEALWLPSADNICGDGSVKGSAFLKVKRLSDGAISNFSVTNISFFKIDITGPEAYEFDLGNLNSVSNLTVDLADYSDAIIAKCGLSTDDCLTFSKAPISFVDLNFDSVGELIVRQPCNGQRGLDTYEVYEMDSSGRLDDELYNITSKEPYNSLDGRSVVNLSSREITIVSASGACSVDFLTYQFGLSKNAYRPNQFESFNQQNNNDSANQSCVHRIYETVENSSDIVNWNSVLTENVK
jgi:hypothetical protein